MSVIDTLVYDRTDADVALYNALRKTILSIGWDNVTEEQRTEWKLGGAETLYDSNDEQLFDSDNEPLTIAGSVIKGRYNYSDINRVGEALNFIRDELNYIGYNITWTAVTTWDLDSEPSEEDMNLYLDYLEDIHDIYDIQLPDVPDNMLGITLGEANDIEKLLYLMHGIIYKISNTFRHCGVTMCGEAIGGLIQ